MYNSLVDVCWTFMYIQADYICSVPPRLVIKSSFPLEGPGRKLAVFGSIFGAVLREFLF